jgi:hypothetical protein
VLHIMWSFCGRQMLLGLLGQWTVSRRNGCSTVFIIRDWCHCHCLHAWGLCQRLQDWWFISLSLSSWIVVYITVFSITDLCHLVTVTVILNSDLGHCHHLHHELMSYVCLYTHIYVRYVDTKLTHNDYMCVMYKKSQNKKLTGNYKRDCF